MVSGLILARRLGSSSVDPMAIAAAIVATTSSVRLDGRPSPYLLRLLILRLGSLCIIGGPFSSKRHLPRGKVERAFSVHKFSRSFLSRKWPRNVESGRPRWEALQSDGRPEQGFPAVRHREVEPGPHSRGKLHLRGSRCRSQTDNRGGGGAQRQSIAGESPQIPR